MNLRLLLGFAVVAGCGDNYGSLAPQDLSANVDIGEDLAGVQLLGDGGPDLVFNPGPSITIDKPSAGAIVGGTHLIIQATITSPAGIVDSSVVAVFGGNAALSSPLVRNAASDQFVGTFDVGKLGVNYVLPNLQVRATDKQGLSGETAIQVVVDNTPPKMSLTPPPVRFSKVVTLQGTTAMGVECSQAYNPVGELQPINGQVVPQLFWLRAMIMDRGNDAPGLNIQRFAGVDPASVEIVAMPASATSPPLAVHTVGYAGDETPDLCDDVNPALLPASGADMAISNSVVTVAMQPIPLAGNADYTGYVATDGGAPPAGCDQLGDPNATAPQPLCAQADPQMYFVLPVYFQSASGIWTIPPVTAGDPGLCVGTEFDSLNEQIPDGPSCIVVHGRDLLGNHTVSAVLHVCINHTGGKTCPGAPGWKPTDPTTWPNCTGTYDPSTNTTTSKPCNPWKFENGLVFPDNPGR